MDGLPGEAELVHGSWVEVLDEDVALLDEPGEDFLAVGGLGVEGKGLLVGVELQEVVGGFVGCELEFLTGGVAYAGAFDFDDVGAQPCEHLGAGRAALDFREVDDLDTL